MEKASASGARPRRPDRTRVACRRCNSKKIKCTASTSLPCRACVSSRSECVLIDSQRGRYVRRSDKNARGRGPPASALPSPIVPDEMPSPEPSILDQSPFHQPGGREDDRSSIASRPITQTDASGGQLLQSLSQSFDSRAPTDSSATFYLHIADQSVRSGPQQEPIVDAVSTFYAGESFSLTYVINDVLGPFLSERQNYQKRLHFPIAEGFDPSDTGRENIVNAQLELLRERGLLRTLNTETLRKLLRTYFRWFNPSFPLLVQQGFFQKCLDNQISLLLLNAVLLVAVTICDAHELSLIGVSSRHEARTIFYRQAKALYDADSDPDKVNNVIAVFLMSFWWGGSNDEKDSFHWLGIAVNLAQSLGMHRSMAKSYMSKRKAQLWRRIWWCLRIRDTLTSGSIGRPPHIGDRDCDVEMLEPSDIPDIDGGVECEEKYYVCQMARLSIIFSKIIHSRYAPLRVESMEQREIIERDLDEFRAQIPKVLSYNGINAKTGQGLWASMLLMAYNFGVILLCRPPSSNGAESGDVVWGNIYKASEAANETTRIMEDILSSSAVRLCQIYTIPALFNSLSMHVFALCTSGSIGRELAENRAKICMLGLTCLQEAWPVSGWILKLFVNIMERLRKKLAGGMNDHTGTMGFGNIPTGDRSYRLSGTGSLNSRNGSEIHSERESGDEMGSKPQGALDPLSTLSNSGPNHAGTENFPNLFALDDLLSDCNAGQVNFFDLLMVPNYDNPDSRYPD